MVLVTRYMGAKNIREMMQKDQYIEAFTHTQLGIEKNIMGQNCRNLRKRKSNVS